MKTMKLQSIMTDSNDYHPKITKGFLKERGVIHTWMIKSHSRSLKSYCLHYGKKSYIQQTAFTTVCLWDSSRRILIQISEFGQITLQIFLDSNLKWLFSKYGYFFWFNNKRTKTDYSNQWIVSNIIFNKLLDLKKAKNSLCKIPIERNLSLGKVRIKSKMGHNECNKQQGKEKKKLKW